ncbi:MAG: hypothetical protein WCJ97_04450 [Phycisphaerae bacterium]
MEKLYLRLNIGLGDLIIFSPMVRYYASKYIVYTPVRKHNLPTFNRLFKSCDNINACMVDSGEHGDNQSDQLADEYKKAGCHVISQSWNVYDTIQTGLRFDELFYAENKLNFDDRWGKFEVTRDREREDEVYNTIVKSEKYIFLHDDAARNLKLDTSLLPDGVSVVRPEPGVSDTIVDYLTVMERAVEIHGMDSSFALLADSVIDNKKMYLHRYVRQGISSASYRKFIPHLKFNHQYGNKLRTACLLARDIMKS